ncbi:MAG: tryptophan synthase subunit alpha [Candidatus Helarchaeota archaeon]
MNTISEVFKQLKKNKEGAFMPFVTLGDPNRTLSIEIIKTLIENGADFMELGIPFSDPIADGKTIQMSSQRALEMGMNTDIAFSMVKEIRQFSSIPILFLTYYNIVLQYPLEAFFKNCKDNHVQGIVIPDLPIEEAAPVIQECLKNNVNLILFIAPNTSETRLTKIIENARGFLYFVSTYGTTGARKKVETSTLKNLLRFTTMSEIPIMPGFGISSPLHVKELIKAGAAGVIVGSAIIKKIEENLKKPDKMLGEIGDLTRKLKNATKMGGHVNEF